ncbi:iron complex transport system substrate-binding protein [Paenibacillus sp. yr247]|uniref:ABC transporter substrate-binding protein n=1 Tax=Paenibacillus sp. yr247 TaxID=1761880 RepID=UPI00088B1809|nr:ABC transporter substrate-binding protein [Paenibacillus sp. yr247]SDO75625.1 iron complex transport system substrate-binding protein [Paenibacillus sp. yr247]
MKKFSVLLIIILLIVLSACGQAVPTPQQSSAGTNEKESSKEPKIASLSIHLTNHLLALGITPVGSVIGGDVKDFLPHVGDRLKNTKKLGVVTDPDMEALLELKPDVILVDKQYAGKDLSKFEKIAPTHSFNLDEGTWRDTLKAVAKLVNREQQADDFIKSYQAQADRVKSLILNKIGDGTVMAIRVTAKEVRVMGMKRPIGPVLFNDLGLKPAKGVEKINAAFATISQEVLPDYDADAIFVIVNKDNDAEKIFKQLQDNPIWNGLKAVKNNHVYTLDGQPWLDYSSLGQKIALENAEKIFAK